MYRQGDVLLCPVPKLPDDAKRLETEVGRVVLARGTATGHTHAFDHGAAMFATPAGDRFLMLETGAALVHEEHSTIAVPAGIYAVIRQREYAPDAIRTVED